jgi:hypothetical protein
MQAHFPPFTRTDTAARAELAAQISDTESKLRTALAYVNHARSLLREALGDEPSTDSYQRDRDATGA